MASSNRTNHIQHLLKVLKKHFKPTKPPASRTVLENLLFACCLENSVEEDAEAALAALHEQYFDWNEVRVSTVQELAESMKMLVDPEGAAARLKRTLQSVFEAHYAFDLETLTKENLGKASERLAKYPGTTPFVVAYVTQAALGGHAIPVNRGLLLAFHVLGVISDEEFEQGVVPGLERAVPKSKGQEAGSVLHQFGVFVGRNPHSPAVRKMLLEIDPECKERLPKRSSKSAGSGDGASTSSQNRKKKSSKGASGEEPATSPKKKTNQTKKKTADQKKPPAGETKKKKSGASGAKPAVKKAKTASRRLAKSKPR